jgi:hypothetical protein
MDVCGVSIVATCKFITFNPTRRAEGLSFFEERRGDICDRKWGDRTHLNSVTLDLVSNFCVRVLAINTVESGRFNGDGVVMMKAAKVV